MVEIISAEILFTLNLIKKSHFALRFIAVIILLLGIAAFFPVPIYNAWYSSIMFLLLFISTIPMFKFCYDEPWINIFFCVIAAYTLQHFAYELSNLILSLIVLGRSPILGLYDSGSINFDFLNKETLFYALIYLLCYLTAYTIVYFFFGKKIKKGQNLKIKSMSLLFLISVGLLTNIVLNSFLIYSDINFNGFVITTLFNMLNCILLLYCQFTLLHSKELTGEIEFIKKLWYQGKKQYMIRKETIDLINLKSHDMRHQIRNIGKTKHIESEVIEEIEKAISLYDSAIKTENEVLDIILTEKNLICYNNGIMLTCIADGKLLNFMNAADLYSLFGNALDNAIEAVLKISDKSNRVITLKLYSVGDLISINIKNFFYGQIEYDEDGFPITTKGDFAYHGYGLKSISYIVDKYDGNLSFVIKDNIFNLNILIPKNSNN